MSKHTDRVAELVVHEAAAFILREATGQSLITVTRALLSKKAEHARIFVSVFPKEESRAALAFLSRSTRDFREHLATHARLHPIPSIEFVLDEGELARQHLDEISKKS